MRMFIVNLFLLSLFFEGNAYSFYLFGARIRISQLITVLGILYFALGLFVGKGKMKIKKTPIDVLVLMYIGINFLAVSQAVFMARSFKITLLILSLYLIYFLLVNFITTKQRFDKAFRMLLWVGMIEISYGIYQVIAGVINVVFNLHLPIGYMGMVHADYIGAIWGRPYGTFVEPVWYGAVCMFYLLVFITLYYSKIIFNRKFYFWGMLLSLFGLFVSFVRAAWLGFFAGLIVLLYLKYKSRILRFNYYILIRNAAILISLVLLVCLCIEPIRTVLINRIVPGDTTSRFDLNNIRLVAMKTSIKAFLRNPIIGNGPGSSAVSGIIESGQIFDPAKVEQGAYNGNIVLTVLEDTGIIGVFVFILLILKIVSINLKRIPRIEDSISVIAIATFSGLCGLFVSYMFSHGFWIPFTWVFLAFNMIALRIGL